jgi:circadian clock protein KaiC
MGAQWIAFDGIDMLLRLLDNPAAERREIYRLRDWLEETGLTAILTAKTDGALSHDMQYGFMEFMVDCVVRLDRRLEEGVSVHRLQITKFRGSAFASGEFPVSFNASGLDVAGAEPAEMDHAASPQRVTAGFGRLDEMLGGGLYRGSATLITGAPGTSKTTLAGKFAESACERGERVLFVSFDEAPDPICRNLSSVGIKLAPHQKRGLLRMYSARTESSGAEEQLQKLRALLAEHRPRCLVIDPLSAIGRSGKLSVSRGVAARLVNMGRDLGLTALYTALVGGGDAQEEATELQVSTIADTWIHLSYLVRSGERNRALSIVKSRGTWHSNQVREIVLAGSGPTLADVYAEDGEVLMGTLRWQKEAEQRARLLARRGEYDHKSRELQFNEAETQARIDSLQRDLQRQREEVALNSRSHEERLLSSSDRETTLRSMRGERREADAPRAARRADPPRPKKNGNGAA